MDTLMERFIKFLTGKLEQCLLKKKYLVISKFRIVLVFWGLLVISVTVQAKKRSYFNDNHHTVKRFSVSSWLKKSSLLFLRNFWQFPKKCKLSTFAEVASEENPMQSRKKEFFKACWRVEGYQLQWTSFSMFVFVGRFGAQNASSFFLWNNLTSNSVYMSTGRLTKTSRCLTRNYSIYCFSVALSRKFSELDHERNVLRWSCELVRSSVLFSPCTPGGIIFSWGGGGKLTKHLLIAIFFIVTYLRMASH